MENHRFYRCGVVALTLVRRHKMPLGEASADMQAQLVGGRDMATFNGGVAGQAALTPRLALRHGESLQLGDKRLMVAHARIGNLCRQRFRFANEALDLLRVAGAQAN